MGVADIIVALVGFGMLVVVVACAIAGFAVIREIWAVYRGYVARVRQNPRFGVSAMFTLVTIVATACALFRLGGEGNPAVVTAIVALAAFVIAIGIVVGVKFVARDLYESWSRRRQSFNFQEVIWPEPAPLDSDDSAAADRR
ncbi:MAG: hypothetical protein ACREHD_21365 [Pirellulales bacterium]